MQLRKILTPLAQTLTSTLLGACLSLAVGLPAAAQSGGDDVLLDMQQAYRKGDRKKLAALLPQARGHVLEPWAAYWELKARLDEASPQEVQAFLTRYAGTYQEDRMRNDWLLLLGQRRDWSTFAAEHPSFRMGDDREVRCYALAVEFLRSGADVAADVRRNWYAQREADDGCAFAADRLHESKKLSDLDIWRKARMAMEANRPKTARVAAAIVSDDAPAQIAEISNSSIKYLAKRASAASRTRKELVVLALVKLATDDPAQAAQILDSKWSVHLTPEERNWVWGVIGKQAATKLQDSATGYFANVSRDADLNDDLLGWKVRAALRQGQWKAVLSATAAMSDEARADPTWAYWRARALLAGVPAAERKTVESGAAATPADATATPRHRAEVLEANRLLESIASIQGFYEVLALEELGRRATVPTRPAPPTAAEKSAALQNPGLNRALYAIGIGLRGEGVREWNYTTNLHERGGMNDRELLAAAELACAREVWDRCINTSERTKAFIDIDQRFPMPFRDEVVRRSKEIDLDPAYVYGLIRQESRFIMDARSSVGASGLMQVMPATARWTARKIGMNNFRAEQITDRDTNIAIGTGYLKLVLDDFDGSMPLAAAAYNAGPGRPRNWRNGPVMEAAIWAENVPFTETRDYVKKVLANTTLYATVLTGQPQSLKKRLGTVGPRDPGSMRAENRDLP
ncbi:MAG: lytic transglycosylase domain-containing protein [Burkholderiaceae bacterium]|nr:lytic transglycosylase domain-containing protein [Burkholderiaceae bacterium]